MRAEAEAPAVEPLLDLGAAVRLSGVSRRFRLRGARGGGAGGRRPVGRARRGGGRGGPLGLGQVHPARAGGRAAGARRGHRRGRRSDRRRGPARGLRLHAPARPAAALARRAGQRRAGPGGRAAWAAARRAGARRRCSSASGWPSSSGPARPRCRAACASGWPSCARCWPGRPVLLLDEPFASLDAITRADMQEWLAGALATEPRTVRAGDPRRGGGAVPGRPRGDPRPPPGPGGGRAGGGRRPAARRAPSSWPARRRARCAPGRWRRCDEARAARRAPARRLRGRVAARGLAAGGGRPDPGLAGRDRRGRWPTTPRCCSATSGVTAVEVVLGLALSVVLGVALRARRCTSAARCARPPTRCWWPRRPSPWWCWRRCSCWPSTSAWPPSSPSWPWCASSRSP